MAHTSLADHVISFPDALPAAVCEALIGRFEASTDQEARQRDDGHSFVQLDISRHWPDQSKLLTQLFLSYFAQYKAAVNAEFWPPAFSFENLRIKRYLPNGRDGFPPHVDVMGQAAAKRFMTAMIYLNATAGGETVFPGLGLSIPPETGKLLAFPPIWLFPHAGLPPRVSPKYILHTYLCYPS